MLAVALSLLLSSSSDGDPPPRHFTLWLARPVSTRAPTDGSPTENVTITFDLRVEWPLELLKSVPAAETCATTLTLPDGTTPTLREKRTASGAGFFVSQLSFAAKEVASPQTWELFVKCAELDSGARQRFGVFGTSPNAWMVMATGAKSRAELQPWLDKCGIGCMRWNEFPFVLESQWVLGLNPGFHVVVLAVTDDEALAKTLVKELQAHDEPGAYLKAVWWPGRLDTRLLILESVVDSEKVMPDWDNELFMLQSGVKGPPNYREVRGRSRLFGDGTALLLHTRAPDGGGDFQLAVSGPQTQCEESPKSFKFTDKKVQRIKKLSLKCLQGD